MAETQPLNWIVQPETKQGPLNDAQIMKLAEDFDIPESDMRTLSEHLAYPLSGSFILLGALEYVRAVQKGRVELEKVIKELRHAEKRLRNSEQLYSNIRIQFPAIRRGVADPNDTIRRDLDRALLMVELLNKHLTQCSTKHTIFAYGHKKRGRETDDRRIVILSRIFDSWARAGRNVTVSTIGSSSERTGPLINFSNAVVRCLTDPPTGISGATIWSDMKQWRLEKQTDPSVLTADD